MSQNIFKESLIVMNNLENLKKRITFLREEMHELINSEDFLTANNVVSISQELDKALDEYYKIKNNH
ncbi:aspartyl-phosphate phosphatase Spo0E family protein [Clostridium sp. D2Q-11]|uniref:Aspartyl-phosphate phosphatase Spo0E family protein n=1 Tax=Anaeromonas frigoriresistens TaxID=2683708 RepID=A0A942Z7N4_9FIRM|nr:aspartyl-phosphate phosphatase Spo0E family protein [Anaeromonas frigoriresistens]